MTKETEVEVAPAAAMVSRDREEGEVVELVETEAPPEKDYEDIVAESEDPRAHIYARHNEKREAELQEADESALANGYTGEESLENHEPKGTIEGQSTDSAPHGEEMVEIKVYGDVRQVAKSKVDKAGGIAEYQKQVAVQEGMQRNADQANALRAKEEAIAAREAALAAKEAAIPTLDSQTGQPPPTDPPSGDQNLEAMARQYQEAVYDGSDDAPSILASMVATAAGKGESFDKDAFRKQVKEEVFSDQRKSKIVAATHALIAEHPELNQRDEAFDPRTFTAVDDETSVVERQHPDWEPDMVVQEAFKRIQKWKGVSQTSTMQDKQAAKRAINRPRSGTQRYTTPPPAPAPTNSDYVRQQRIARGQEVET